MNDVVLISSSSSSSEEDDVYIISDDDDDVCKLDEDEESEDDDCIILDDYHQSVQDDDINHVQEFNQNNNNNPQGSKDAPELSTDECKSYLKKHGVRVSGTKEELLQRIKEHERLKDGGGESLYPRSSFSINCTGDACKGDVVLFKQNIRKGATIVGRRLVAGRIVNDSYGSSRQQHTFSVDVLWSKWSEKLNPLSILLVKGRYLYKLGTFRQPWENEAERSKVLGEKHSRGDAARHKRKLRQAGFACNNNKGRKCQKVSDRGPSKSKQPTDIDKKKSAKRKGPAPVKESTSANRKKAVTVLFRKLKNRRSTQRNFCPVPNLNQNSYKNSDHLQEASSSFSHDRNLVPYSHHNNGNSGANHLICQPPGYHHCNHKQPIPRFNSRYPRSSFTIDCTGDACEGDIVLFEQDVYKRKNIARKRGTIVGRIVKEVYFAPKKRHTFTIEVLWTKGALYLRRLSTVEVKDWNLYRLGTLRQPWENELKRLEVIEKKQRRVEAANKYKHKWKKTNFSNNKGIKRQQVSSKGPSPSLQPTEVEKQESSMKSGTAPIKESTTTHTSNVVRLQEIELKRSTQPNLCPNQNINLNPIPNPNPNLNSNPTSNSNLQPKPNSDLTLKSNPNPNPNLKQKPKPNRKQEPQPNPISNPNSYPNPNPYTNCIYSNYHPQEASLFFPYERTLFPNLPPHGFSPNIPPHGFLPNRPSVGFLPNRSPAGFLPNQPTFGFSHNQPPFGFSGYGQRGPNHLFYPPPDYNHHKW